MVMPLASLTKEPSEENIQGLIPTIPRLFRRRTITRPKSSPVLPLYQDIVVSGLSASTFDESALETSSFLRDGYPSTPVRRKVGGGGCVSPAAFAQQTPKNSCEPFDPVLVPSVIPISRHVPAFKSKVSTTKMSQQQLGGGGREADGVEEQQRLVPVRRKTVTVPATVGGPERRDKRPSTKAVQC